MHMGVCNLCANLVINDLLILGGFVCLLTVEIGAEITVAVTFVGVVWVCVFGNLIFSLKHHVSLVTPDTYVWL